MSTTINWPTAGAPPSGSIPTDNLLEVVAYYVRRLIIQYSDKPKAQGTVALFVKQMIADDVASLLLHAYDLDTAVGPQLDILAKYIGIQRGIGLPESPPKFSFVDYDAELPQGTHGFALYDGSSPADAGLLSYAAHSTPTDLSDSSFAFMLRLKVAINHLDGTYAGIQQFVADHLADWVTVTDNQDMTLTYTVAADTPVAPTILAAYLPKPIGVQKIISYV